jgi:hypothetical protein
MVNMDTKLCSWHMEGKLVVDTMKTAVSCFRFKREVLSDVSVLATGLCEKSMTELQGLYYVCTAL